MSFLSFIVILFFHSFCPLILWCVDSSLPLILYIFTSYFCMCFIMFWTILSHLLSYLFTCLPVLTSLLPYSRSSSHPFFLALHIYSLAFLIYFSPIINKSYVAPRVIFVTLLPSFILLLCGWSVRSRCPGGRWEKVDVWFPKGIILTTRIRSTLGNPTELDGLNSHHVGNKILTAIL